MTGGVWGDGAVRTVDGAQFDSCRPVGCELDMVPSLERRSPVIEKHRLFVLGHPTPRHLGELSVVDRVLGLALVLEG